MDPANVRKVTNPIAGSSDKYEGNDINYIADIVNGTHSTDSISPAALGDKDGGGDGTKALFADGAWKNIISINEVSILPGGGFQDNPPSQIADMFFEVGPDESQLQTVMGRDGKLTNLEINIFSNDITGDVILTLRKNAVDTADVITITSSDSGVKSYPLSTVFSKGDLISWSISGNGDGHSVSMSSGMLEIQYDG